MIKIELKLNNIWTEITQDIKTDSIQFQETLFTDLKPASNTVEFQLTKRNTVYDNLLSQTDDIDIDLRITDGLENLFIGVLSTDWKMNINSSGQSSIKITGEDYTNAKLKADWVSANKKSTKYLGVTAISVVNSICTLSGVTFDTFSYTRGDLSAFVYFTVSDLAKKNYYDILSSMLLDFGYVFNFNKDGQLSLYKILTTESYGDIENISSVEYSKTRKKYNQVNVKWKSLKPLSNQNVFNDTTDGDTSNSCNIVIPGSGYYPTEAGADKDVYSDYKLADGSKVIASSGATADITCSGGITYQFTDYGTFANVKFRNTLASDQTITKFKLNASVAVIEADDYTTTSDLGGKKKFVHEAKYLSTDTDAKKLTEVLYNYYANLNNSFIIRSPDNHSLGEQVILNVNVVNQKCRIVSKIKTFSKSELFYSFTYTLQSVADLVVSDYSTTGIIVTNPIKNLPTKEEVLSQGFQTRYARSANAPATPIGNNPAGWTITVPSGSDAIWMSGANFDFSGSAGPWYSPVRFTGAATTIGVLSNEMHTVPCDANGNNGNYTGAFCEMSVYEGSVDTTSLYSFSESHSAGVTLVMLNNRVTVTLLTIDAGYIDITANRSGMSAITKRFSITRSRLGDATPIYKMSASSTVVKTYLDGSLSPSSLIFSASSSVGLTNPTPYNGYFKFFVNNVCQFTSQSPQSTYTWSNLPRYPTGARYPTGLRYPALNMTVLLDDVTVARMELWSNDLTVLLDSQSIVFFKDVGFQLDDIISATLEDVPNYTPKYLGKFQDELPSTYRLGDWFLIYGTGTGSYTRGIYLVETGNTVRRLTGLVSSEGLYISSALSDILYVSQNGFGDVSIYGAITYISNLVSSSAFIDNLIANNSFITNLVANSAFISNLSTKIISLQSGGKVKSANFDATHGFQLDGDTGKLTARNIDITGNVVSSGATFDQLRVSNGFYHYFTNAFYQMGYIRGYVSFRYFYYNDSIVVNSQTLNVASISRSGTDFMVTWTNSEINSYSVTSISGEINRAAYPAPIPIAAYGTVLSINQTLITWAIGATRPTAFITGDSIKFDIICIGKD